MGKVILDLCGGTGSWSQPYKDAGYDVHILTLPDVDVLTWPLEPIQVHGILAAPPCTAFARSGSRYWPQKDASGETALAVSIVERCMDIIDHYKPVWWALENPIGRINKLCPRIGIAPLEFHPYWYGDPYYKRTRIYGKFNRLTKTPVYPGLGEYIHTMGPSKDRAMLRSITPPGFAKAFFEANP